MGGGHSGLAAIGTRGPPPAVRRREEDARTKTSECQLTEEDIEDNQEKDSRTQYAVDTVGAWLKPLLPSSLATDHLQGNSPRPTPRSSLP